MLAAKPHRKNDAHKGTEEYSSFSVPLRPCERPICDSACSAGQEATAPCASPRETTYSARFDCLWHAIWLGKGVTIRSVPDQGWRRQRGK